MPIRKRIRATCASSGQSKRFLAALVLAHTPVQKNCMTPKPAQTFIFFHLRPHWVRAKKVSFSLVFSRCKWGYGWGRNRNADTWISVQCFIKTRLQCIVDSKRFVAELTWGARKMHQSGRQTGNSEAPAVLPPDTEISVAF